MNRNILRKIRRTLAFALAIALCGNTIPRTAPEVRAAERNVSGTAALTLTADNVSFTEGIGTVGEDDTAYPVYAYTGQEIKIVDKVTFTDDSGQTTTLTEGTDYDVAYSDNTAATDNAGAKVTITGKGSYTTDSPIEKSFGIRKQLNNDNTTVNVQNQDAIVYDGTEQEPEAEVAFTEQGGSSSVLTKDSDYTVSYADNQNATSNTAKAKITVSGAGVYFGTAEGEFAIQPKDISTESLTVAEQKYTGEAIAVDSLEVMLGDTVFASENYSLSYVPQTGQAAEIKEVGGYSLTIAGQGNYTGTNTITLQVIAGELGAECVEVENAYKHVKEDSGEVSYYYQRCDGVVIRAANEAGASVTYAITSCTVGGSYDAGKEEVVLTEGSSEVTVSVEGKNAGGAVCYSDSITLKFVQDNTVPTLEITPNNTNEYTDAESQKTWAQAISAPVVTATDAGAGVAKVYYTTADLSGITEDALAALDITGYAEWSDDADLEEDTVCYFLAEDHVGNRTLKSMTTPMLDTTAPVITVKDGDRAIADGETIYLNKEALTDGSKSFTVTADDGENGSGVNSDFESNINNVFQATASGTGETITTGKEAIENSATDNVKNAGTHKFTVVYDNVPPVISSLEVTPVEADAKAEKKEESAYVSLFTSKDVQITVQVQENLIDGEYQLKDLTLVKNVEGGEPETIEEVLSEKCTEVSTDETNGTKTVTYTWTISVSDADGGYLRDAYQVVAHDKAENQTASKKIAVEIDKNAPELTADDIKIDQEPNDENWVNQDTTFTVTVTDADKSGAEISLYWTKEEATDAGAMGVANADSDNWQEVTQKNVTTTDKAAVYTFTYTEEDNTFDGTYRFKAVDALGQESAEVRYALKKDKVTPDTKNIYVEYKLDEAADAEKVSFFKEIYNYLFARNKINVVLYVHDDISRVASVTYQYADAKEQTADVKQQTAYANQDASAVIDGVAYSMIEFTLSVNKAEFVKDNLHILEITDNAGNKALARQGLTELKSGEVLIIDNVSPKLDMAFESDDKPSVVMGKYFLSQQGDEKKENITLTYTEAFYEYYLTSTDAGNTAGQPVKPVIEIVAVDAEGNESEVEAAVIDESAAEPAEGDENAVDESKAYIRWEVFDSDTSQITATISLPYSTKDNGEEIAYIIRTTYADGSGNQLIAGTLECGDVNAKETADSSAKTNQYESSIIVLDNKTPELTSYEIVGTTDRKDQNGVDVYQHQNIENAAQDVVLHFTIVDNAQYWTPEHVNFKIYNESNAQNYLVINGGDGRIKWTSDANDTSIHNGTYILAACTEAPATYHAEIFYADLVGNRLLNNGVQEGELNEGTYISKAFVLDETAPLFEISYNEADRLVRAADTAVKNDIVKGADAYPATGYTAYYKEDITVSFSISEDYANISGKESMETLDDYTCSVFKDGDTHNAISPKITWTQAGKEYKGSFTLSEEGSYTIEMTYRDLAANPMTAGGTVQGSQAVADSAAEGTDAADTRVVNGKYTSTRLVIDRTAPEITTSYVNAEPVAHINANKDVVGARSYFDNTNVCLRIQVTDDNARYEELITALSGITARDSSGAALESSQAASFISGIEAKVVDENGFYWDIPLATEANYTIPITFTDLAGNVAVINGNAGSYTAQATVDATSPEKLELSYTVEPISGVDRVVSSIKYADWSYLFADSRMTITAAAADNVAGIQRITFHIEGDEVREDQYREFAPAAEGVYETTVPLAQRDFKGSVEAFATDWTNRQSGEKHGYVVESAGKHSESSSTTINPQTAPSRVVDGVDYYNTDVSLSIEFSDQYAGIREWQYSAGNRSDSRDYAAIANDTEEPEQEIVLNEIISVDLGAEEHNANEVPVTARFVDNAGHVSEAEAVYNIDVTKPVITVIYDLNAPANEVYYNGVRTATVEIQERNFSESDVEFTITNTDGVMPVISGWTAFGDGDDTIHRCTVTFAEDGDYTFTVAFQDKAGNKADYSRVDEFTIDRTEPVYTVVYDNNESTNDYYYAAGRTATIDIQEHNFDASLVNITMTAAQGEAGVPAVSGWSRNGDHNIATIHFSADADYTFRIFGMDMAENPMDDYAGDHFVVDTTAPDIEIFDIENMSANNGVVMPGIRYSDINYDAENSIIDMVGCNNGKVEMNGDITRTNTGVEIKLHDFEHVQGMDDLYTMTATVFDLAGNSSEASVVFSVNRFGSVYTFDKATAELIGENGRYYTNEEQELVITETNVDTLEFKEIICNLNGKLTTLKEGEQFTVSESGSDMSWKQYTYTLAKENFEEEGTYLLTIYSEDRAANTSDNSSKGKKIEFVVDKTSPSVLISGIVNNEQYRESSKNVTIDVQDNVLLSEVRVAVNGADTVYRASQIEDLDGKITLAIGSANNWQTLSVTALDAAGNAVTSEKLNFLITTNIFIQFIMNRQLLFGSIAAAAVAAAGGSYFAAAKKKKKAEKAE